jgi:hypothetical protein
MGYRETLCPDLMRIIYVPFKMRVILKIEQTLRSVISTGEEEN